MRRKIPSIDTLLAFETAARYLSFTRAADELALTQSAVSRQIAALEASLGVQLFNRIKQRLSLTDAGDLYAKQIRKSLARIERDTLDLMSYQGAGGVLELAVIPTFATRWLIPRLPAFSTLHPDITVNLTTRPEPFLFTDTTFDAAIHFGDPIWPGAVADYLLGEEMIPVCSPTFLRGAKRLKPQDLGGFCLLHQSARPEAWGRWFEAAEVEIGNAMKGPRYELFSMLVEAAVAGMGVALVPHFFVVNELSTRKLIMPCHIALKSNKGYYFVYPERKQNSVLVMAFKEWLLETARGYREADSKEAPG